MRFRVLAFLAVLALAASAQGAWLSGYSYRQLVTITGQTGTGTNYPVRLDIGASTGGKYNLGGHAAHFPFDIAFTVDDGSTTLSSWPEYTTSTANVTEWVKVAADLGTNKTIYCYYGNSSVTTDTSDGTKVFDAFDDFSGMKSLTGMFGILKSSYSALTNTLAVDTNTLGEETWSIVEANGILYKFDVEFSAGGAGGGDEFWLSTSAVTDGINWSWNPNNPFFAASGIAGRFDNYSLDGYSVIYSTAMDPNAPWLMAYSALPSASTSTWPNYIPQYEIGLATAASPYGPWTRYSGAFSDNGVIISTATGWANGHVLCPRLMIKGNTIHMFYNGISTSDVWAVGHATAALTSPFQWHKDTANPILSPSATWEGGATGRLPYPFPIEDPVNGVDYLFYSAFSGSWSASNFQYYNVGYASSTDPSLSVWLKYPSNPLFTEPYTVCPQMLTVNNRWRLYYNNTGTSMTSDNQMHVAYPSMFGTYWLTQPSGSTYTATAVMYNGTLTVHGNTANANQYLYGSVNFGNYIIRGRTKGEGDYSYFGLGTNYGGNTGSYAVGVSPNMYLYSFNAAVFTSSATVLTSNTWYTGEIRTVKSTSDKLYDEAGDLLATNTTHVRTADEPVFLGVYNTTGILDVDWLAVRKNMATEPAFGSAAAEEVGSISSFLRFKARALFRMY